MFYSAFKALRAGEGRSSKVSAMAVHNNTADRCLSAFVNYQIRMKPYWTTHIRLVLFYFDLIVDSIVETSVFQICFTLLSKEVNELIALTFAIIIGRPKV